MHKKIKPLLIAAAVALTSGIAMVAACSTGNKKKTECQTSVVTRGDLTITVSSTGTLAAVGAVEVGTEISGTVEKVLVDFNDKVSKGQILATLKTDLLKAAIRDAEATLRRAQAQVDQAQVEFTQNKTLYEKGFLSQKEFLPVQTDLESDKAVMQSAQASLDRARTNLTYATIRSPIDGVILQRSVEAGQTVAASFSTPTLFIIAKDLTKMEIEALVDETDISKIKSGQPVRFTVSAYSDKEFNGTVTQIRRKPATIQNVVNYTIIVDAPNTQELLLPGMTATIDFVVEQTKNVLLVPNDAFSVKPTQEMVRALKTAHNPSMRPMGLQDLNKGFGPPSQGEAEQGKPLWYLDKNDKPAMVLVQTLSSDESVTALADSAPIAEGTRVIVGTKGGTEAAGPASNSRSPMGPPPMPF